MIHIKIHCDKLVKVMDKVTDFSFDGNKYKYAAFTKFGTN